MNTFPMPDRLKFWERDGERRIYINLLGHSSARAYYHTGDRVNPRRSLKDCGPVSGTPKQ